MNAAVPSFTIPTAKHFWKRQNWHRFRRRLSTGQFLSARQTYLAPFCTVLCRKKGYLHSKKKPGEYKWWVWDRIIPWRTPCSLHKCGLHNADRQHCRHTPHKASSPWACVPGGEGAWPLHHWGRIGRSWGWRGWEDSACGTCPFQGWKMQSNLLWAHSSSEHDRKTGKSCNAAYPESGFRGFPMVSDSPGLGYGWWAIWILKSPR